MAFGGINPLRGALNGATAQNPNAQFTPTPQGIQPTGGGGMIGGVTPGALGGSQIQPQTPQAPMPQGGPQRQQIQPQSMLGPNPNTGGGQQQMNPQFMQFLQMLMQGRPQQGYQQQGPQQGYNPQSLTGGMNTQQYRMPQQYYMPQQQGMPFAMGGPQMSQYSPMSGMYGNSRSQFSNPYQQGYMRGY